MATAIIDYGMCNLNSVTRAVAECGGEPVLVTAPQQLAAHDRLLLPGVGAFPDAMKLLAEHGWVSAIKDAVLGQGKSLLGICLGMQLLADEGSEGEPTPGLGLIPGKIVRLDQLGCTLRIPHMGWNNLQIHQPQGIFNEVHDGADFYFVHSYAYQLQDEADRLASVEYGVNLCAAVGRGHIAGVQFHPEKSSRAGFKVLRNFLER